MISEKCLPGSSPCGPFIGPSGLLVKGVREGEGKRREDATYDRREGKGELPLVHSPSSCVTRFLNRFAHFIERCEEYFTPLPVDLNHQKNKPCSSKNSFVENYSGFERGMGNAA